MKPHLGHVTAGVLVALAALTACRREVPPPPTPIPDNPPKPTVQLTRFAVSLAPAWRIG